MEDTIKTRSEQLNDVLATAADDPALLQQVAANAITIVAEQEATINGLNGTVAEYETSIGDALQANTELQAKLELANSGVKVLPTIEVNGDTYQAVHAVLLDGQKYTPAQIVENADVAAKLVAGNSSALVKQIN